MRRSMPAACCGPASARSWLNRFLTTPERTLRAPNSRICGMNAMLLVIFGCVGLGLAATRWGERVLAGVVVLGILLTVVYYLLPRYI